MGGRIIVESVAGCLWNRWPDGRGIRSLIAENRLPTGLEMLGVIALLTGATIAIKVMTPSYRAGSSVQA